MLTLLPAPLRGALSCILYTLNTVFWLIPILVFSILRFIFRLSFVQKALSYALDHSATGWISCNSAIQNLLTNTKIKRLDNSQFTNKQWYLVLSNHQSWVDILILQRVLNHQIPFLKFFLKNELIWVPLLGVAWWALDFPFMKRYSREFIAKNPHLKGKDIETTQKACRKFQHKPVSIMNFVEGTRYTKQKHQTQQSQYQHLLNPKAGGIAFVLDAMGDYLTHIVDVTIYYPDGIPTFWQFACGNVSEVTVDIELIAIKPEIIGDYFNNDDFKNHFQQWVSTLWQNKDSKLKAIAKSYEKQNAND